MSTEKLIRITTLIPRKKGMTQEQFYKHWTTIHGPMVVGFMMRHGVIEYRQVYPIPLNHHSVSRHLLVYSTTQPPKQKPSAKP